MITYNDLEFKTVKDLEAWAHKQPITIEVDTASLGSVTIVVDEEYSLKDTRQFLVSEFVSTALKKMPALTWSYYKSLTKEPNDPDTSHVFDGLGDRIKALIQQRK